MINRLSKRQAQGQAAQKGSIMKTRFYLDGKKTTRKAVKEMVGDDTLKKMITEAKETFFKDPYIENSFFVARAMLTIAFE